ncbi:MAG: SusC/RagA family TonB-linked outer membrane protein [Prevotellaceae bacterium]|jgi:TonB-linked SusC/RagA family outer membrane protein|nr:SusC/RagA family TonB-linked outer membrane protein [Prevotellaceae bacterium]
MERRKFFDQNWAGQAASAPACAAGGELRRMRRLLLSLLLLCAALPLSLRAQHTNVSGTVRDGSNEPVAGVSVVVKGTTVGATTDAGGSYTISAPAEATLVFSFLGLTTREEAVAGRGRIDVTMSESDRSLDEVVVTALGIRKASKALGYSVATVNADELVKTGTPNFATALYGKTPGVRIQAAPGGATSAVSINVRGLSSITGNNQPLVIIDGVPIRNGNANEKGYWDEQRISSNGLVDVNPEDIATLSILKGASASALYGSEAANGVVMITTKSGKRSSGLGVDVNISLAADQVAYMPEMQTIFGPGALVTNRNDSYQKATGGFYERTLNGKTYKSIRNTTQQFGPKYDGSSVLYWDGKERPYSAISSNPWKDIFRMGFNQTYNVAITQGAEKSSTRFSYTLVNNTPTQHNSDYSKHNFNLTGGVSLSEKLQVDYTASYVRQAIKNRPYRISRITNNFGGMFGSFEDVKQLRAMTVTSLGYRNVAGNTPSLTPAEAFFFAPASFGGLLEEYYWNILGREQLENSNRLIASATPSFTIIPGLTLRGRIATDLTGEKVELQEKTERPLALGDPTGYYGLTNKRYEIYYGDAMLTYDRSITETLDLTANVGYQGRVEQLYSAAVETNGGLTVENWFHISASKNQPNAKMTKTEILKTALFGTLSMAYNHFAYIEGTMRQETTSTLSPNNNKFFYPSVNASFIFSEALKDLRPSWFSYGKARASYGIVGNAPEVYRANMAYEQKATINNGSWIYNRSPKDLGYENIRPEKKYEWEFGIEGTFLSSRLGFEASYYTNRVVDQILQTTMPQSSGATSILLNVGELANQGLELSLYGKPILSNDFRWELNGNIGFNKNRVTKLMDGIDELQHVNIDGGAAVIVSKVGEPMGDIYTYAPKEDANGNKIVNSNGLYLIDFTRRKKAGNAMPLATGGFGTSVGYKSWTLDAMIDFRIGGDIVHIPYQYMMGRGNLVESLPYRDAEHGGITYYFEGDDFNGKRVPTASSAGPNGERVYDNGMILAGVDVNGNPNSTIVPADLYYNSTYNWGASDETEYAHSIFDNSYLKLRELSLSYSLPQRITGKFACKNLTLSVFGRNLLFLYKNLPAFDAEATDGTSWMSQAQIGGSTATTRTFGFSIRANF